MTPEEARLERRAAREEARRNAPPPQDQPAPFRIEKDEDRRYYANWRATYFTVALFAFVLPLNARFGWQIRAADSVGYSNSVIVGAVCVAIIIGVFVGAASFYESRLAPEGTGIHKGKLLLKEALIIAVVAVLAYSLANHKSTWQEAPQEYVDKYSR